MTKDNEITRGSGNIFADIGLANADELLQKARVAVLVSTLIEKRGLTQTAAALRLNISQSDVSNVVRGKLNNFSLERLLLLVRKLGSDVEIKVTAPTDMQSEYEGTMNVMVG